MPPSYSSARGNLSSKELVCSWYNRDREYEEDFEEEDEDEEQDIGGPGPYQSPGQGSGGQKDKEKPSEEKKEFMRVISELAPEIQMWAQQHGINPEQMAQELWKRMSEKNVDVEALHQTMMKEWDKMKQQIQEHIANHTKPAGEQPSPPEQDPGQGQGPEDPQGPQEPPKQPIDFNDWKQRLQWEMDKLTLWGSDMGKDWSDRIQEMWQQAQSGNQSLEAWQNLLLAKWEELKNWQTKTGQQEQT